MTENPDAASASPSFLPPELQAPAAATGADTPGATPRAGRVGLLIKGAAIVGTGLVAGAFGIALLQGTGSASPAQVGTASTSSPATDRSGIDPQRHGGFGVGPDGGGQAGESRLFGSLTAVGTSSITVTQTDGTATSIPVASTTDIELDGQQVALSSLRSGTSVLVHVLPTAGGGSVAERILAGGAATSGPATPPLDGAGADPGTADATGVANTAARSA